MKRIRNIDSIPCAKDCRDSSKQAAKYKETICEIYNEHIYPTVEKGEFSVWVNVDILQSSLIKDFFESKGYKCEYRSRKDKGESYIDRTELNIEWR